MPEVLEWIATLNQPQAAVLGTAMGSLLGLLAILLGALFNAHLNRNRDDRIRREKRTAIATALRAELSAIRNTLVRNAEGLRKAPLTKSHFATPDLSRHVKVYPALIEELLTLRQQTIERLFEAYGTIDEYSERLALSGGVLETTPTSKPYVTMPAAGAELVATFNVAMAEIVDSAIAELSSELSRRD